MSDREFLALLRMRRCVLAMVGSLRHLFLIFSSFLSNSCLVFSDHFYFFFLWFSAEVRAAEERALSFAERLWTSRFSESDPELQSLQTVSIVAALTTWLFNALNKQLMSLKVASMRGTETPRCAYCELSKDYESTKWSK